MANTGKKITPNKSEIANEQKDSTILVIIGIIVLVVVAFIIFRLTYAFFTSTINKTNEGPEKKEAIVNAASLQVTYEDGASIDIGKKIGPGDTITKKFKVRNEGTAPGHFSIVLTGIVNNFARPQDLKYTLTRGETPAGIGTISVAPLKQFPQTTDGEVVIATDETVSDVNEYTLTITYDNPDIDQSADMGQTLEAKIDIKEVAAEKRDAQSESTTTSTTTTTTTTTAQGGE